MHSGLCPSDNRDDPSARIIGCFAFNNEEDKCGRGVSRSRELIQVLDQRRGRRLRHEGPDRITVGSGPRGKVRIRLKAAVLTAPTPVPLVLLGTLLPSVLHLLAVKRKTDRARESSAGQSSHGAEPKTTSHPKQGRPARRSAMADTA